MVSTGPSSQSRTKGECRWRGGTLIKHIFWTVAFAAAITSASWAEERSAFFGDLHIHTTYSYDAYMGGNVRTTPDDAYRFAKGEVIDHPAGIALRLSGPPLDFLAVTDHAAYLGVQFKDHGDGVLFAPGLQGKAHLIRVFSDVFD